MLTRSGPPLPLAVTVAAACLIAHFFLLQGITEAGKETRIELPAWMKNESPYANKGLLFRVRDKVAYLDLEGRVVKNKNKSSWGTYGDVFMGDYTPADGLTRLVAVKELRIHIMKEKEVQGRLAKELYIWSKLDHPNILPCYGFFIENEINLHLVSPWMSRGTILSYLESNPMADVLLLVKGIAEGIQYLHENDIIHSDIKPDNVLISDFGKPQLCDFGVSRILEASMTFQASTTSMARGTVRYMAKEFFVTEGNEGETYSKQADVWAFGMTIYTIATKHHPYHEVKADAVVMLQIYNGKLPPWPEEDEAWPPGHRGLKNVCGQCWLGKSNRPSMEVIVSRLKECCVSACLECLETMHTQLKFNMSNVESSFLRNREVPRLEEHVKDDGLNAIKFAGLHWVGYALQTDDFNALRGPVTGFFSSLSVLYWIEFLSLTGELGTGRTMLQKFIDHFQKEDQIVHLATEWLAFISNFYDAISISAPHVYISALSWGAPNSVRRRLLVPEDYLISAFPLDKPEGTRKLKDYLRYARRIIFSPDGSKFASERLGGSLLIWDDVTGELIRNVKAHNIVIGDLRFSPDSRSIVTGSRDRTLRIWDVQSGNLIAGPLKGHTDQVWAVAYSPDGTRIVSGSRDKTLRIWDAKTGAAIGEPLVGHEMPVYAVSYSPDGNKIASGSADETLRIWNARTGEQIGEPLVGHTGVVECIAYSTDGRVIVSGSTDMTVRIWDAETGRPVRQPLEGHRSFVWTVSYTPDGSRIVSGSADNAIRIWDARNGSAIGVIPQDGSRWDLERGCFLSLPSWWLVTRPDHPRVSLTKESLIHSDAPTQIPADGWLRTLDGGLFLWVPPKYREDVCCRGLWGNLPPRLKFDWKGVPRGKDWTKVKDMLEEPIDH